MKKKRLRIRKRRIFILLFLIFLTFQIYTYQKQNIDTIFTTDNFGINKEQSSQNYDILILVNKNHKLPDDYKVNVTTFKKMKVAEILTDNLKEMLDSALKQNIKFEITSAYRSKKEQEKILNNEISSYIKKGNSYNSALENAERLVAPSGYSEHETGLAIDFTISTNNYDEKIEAWNWLSENAHHYGFILRYQKGKENITGYDYEPWHYRYVGKEHSKVIYEKGICLEEYLGIEEYFVFDEYTQNAKRELGRIPVAR